MPAASPPEKGETIIVRPNGALDSVGQKNELIRVRFANMIDRLEEIRSLKEDFALLSEPVSDLIRSYPQLQSRLLETEAVLRQETEMTAGPAPGTRRPRRPACPYVGRSQRRRVAAAQGGVPGPRTGILHRGPAPQREGQGGDRRRPGEPARHRDRARPQHHGREPGAAPRSAGGRPDGRPRRAGAHRDPRAERPPRPRGQAAAEGGGGAELPPLQPDQSLRRGRDPARGHAPARLRARDQAHGRAGAAPAPRDADRFRALGAPDRSLLARHEDRGPELASVGDRQDPRPYPRPAARQERGPARRRAQSRRRPTIEKNTLDRRLEATQQEVERQVAMVNELQRSRIELQERVEMLNKAIAAKDFQIESSDNKVASLSERIDQFTKRFEQERSTLEAANRRLTEELQNEKAERSLIQGALEIARESRIKIQKKYVTPAQEDPPRHAGGRSDALRRGGDRDECPAAQIAGRRVRRLPPKPRSLAGLFLLRMGARRGWLMRVIKVRPKPSSPTSLGAGWLCEWEHPTCGGEELEVGVERLERCASSRQPEAKTTHPLSRVERGRGEGVAFDQPGDVTSAAARPVQHFIRHRPSLTPTLSHTGEGEVPCRNNRSSSHTHLNPSPQMRCAGAARRSCIASSDQPPAPNAARSRKPPAMARSLLK